MYSVECSHKNKKIILPRIRERGHARGGEKILIPVVKHTKVQMHVHINVVICGVGHPVRFKYQFLFIFYFKPFKFSQTFWTQKNECHVIDPYAV